MQSYNPAYSYPPFISGWQASCCRL